MMLEQTETVRKRRRVLLGAALGVFAVVAVVALLISALSGPPAPAPADASPAAQASADEVRRALEGARKLLDQDEAVKASVLLSATIAQAPEDQELRTLYAECLLAQGKTGEAYDQLEKAVFIGPDSAELRFFAGTVANAAGKTQQALEHYTMAQSLDPRNPKHAVYLAQIQRKLNETDAAKASLLRAVQLDPALHEAWATLAAISLDENNLGIARQHIAEARALAPGSVVYRLLEARIERRENNPEQALRLLLALGEDEVVADPSLLNEAALCYGLLRRPEAAADLYGRAVERRPNDAETAYEAALWHQRAGIDDAAAVYAERAARLGSEPAQRLLASMSNGDE
jgi:tetratricopeptide (TPR) repeat protein